MEARTEGDLESAFTIIVQRQAGALAGTPDPYFIARREQIIALTNRYAMPAIYPLRWFPDVGGLISYGASPIDLARQMGIYTAKILKGANTGDIPIQQSTKIELVINLKSAKTLGLTVRPSCSPAPTR